MSDVIETLGSSMIHHGKDNDRIYLMKYNPVDHNTIIDQLEKLANQQEYSKIFVKIPKDEKGIFETNGYHEEATIEKFYNGEKDCSFMAKYKTEHRKNVQNKEQLENVLKVAQSKPMVTDLDLLPRYEIRKMGHVDTEAMAKLYKKVFATYPFPIHDANYLWKTMDEHIAYFGVFLDDELIGLSSSELDEHYENAEMTDFAIHPKHRGENLSVHLLQSMEQYMKEIHIKTLYTIARAISYGMNSTFAKLGYDYTGTLYNNTNISGSIESMNVWYKNI